MRISPVYHGLKEPTCTVIIKLSVDCDTKYNIALRRHYYVDLSYEMETKKWIVCFIRVSVNAVFDALCINTNK